MPADAPRAPKPEAMPLNLGGEHVSTWKLGDYRVIRLLGEGAMGKVYEAVQESLQRRVALKLLPDDFAQDPDAVTRFEREAHAAAALVHSSIVPIYHFGCEDGAWFYTMEYVVGRSLRDLLDDPKGPLADQRKVAKYVLNVALGLDYAHQRGVIHRDVKPDNILVREDDQALITDFGLARKRDQKAITQAGALMGTPAYMAPEQAMGRSIDARVDVWALGVTLFECLSGGKMPFPGQTLRELLLQITQQEPASLRAHRPDVSSDLEAIVLKCLRKAPEERYQSGKELGDDLIRFFRGDLVRARDAGLAQVALRKLRKHPLTSALGALLVVGVPAVLGGGALRARVRAVAQAEEQLAAATGQVARPLAAWQEAARALEAARQTRDGPLGAGGAAGAARAQEEVARRLAALREVERQLLDGTAAADALASSALEHVRAALRAAPEGHAVTHAARELARGLLDALRARAERDGDEALVAALGRELVALGLRDPALERRPRLLSVETAPPGARVTLHPVVVGADRAWSLGEARDLGPSPVTPGLEVAPGEYVLALEADGRAAVRVPLHVRRGLEPAEPIAVRVELPSREGVPPGFVYVPPGEFYAGGDPSAVRPLFAQREPVWVAGFFLGAYEVTVEEYVAFLAALPEAERGAHLSSSFQLARDRLAPLAGCERQPVAGVRQESARAYCRWSSAALGRQLRLPTDVEWEKAARGPAGRFFPWGDAFDPAAADPPAQLHRGVSESGLPTLAPVGTRPRDRSIYGVFDLGGNVSEWVEGRFDGEARFGVLRGGSWARGPEVTRLASREPVDSRDTADFLRVRDRIGFRVAFD
jgi:formylglycine-generating enzyme required for sulfatase activity/predicted Ser/Thr protein kinase